MQRPPIEGAVADQAARLYDEGVSRNQIARTLDLSPDQVTRWARSTGRTFDTGRVREANEARRAAAEDLRVQLGLAYLEDAELLRQRAWQPYEVAGIAQKYGEYVTYSHELPPASETLSLISASIKAADAAERYLRDAKDEASYIKASMEALSRLVPRDAD